MATREQMSAMDRLYKERVIRNYEFRSDEDKPGETAVLIWLKDDKS